MVRFQLLPRADGTPSSFSAFESAAGEVIPFACKRTMERATLAAFSSALSRSAFVAGPVFGVICKWHSSPDKTSLGRAVTSRRRLVRCRSTAVAAYHSPERRGLSAPCEGVVAVYEAKVGCGCRKNEMEQHVIAEQRDEAERRVQRGYEPHDD